MSLCACKKSDNWEYPKQGNSWRQAIMNELSTWTSWTCLRSYLCRVSLQGRKISRSWQDILPKERRQALPDTKKWTKESAECVLVGTRRSKALTTTELMHMPQCLHGRRLNSSFLLPAGIVCSSKCLIASQRTSRPIWRIPCMYIHWKDWYRILAKIWTKHGSWTKHLMDGNHPAGINSIRYPCGCTITVFAQLATLAPSWC